MTITMTVRALAALATTLLLASCGGGGGGDSSSVVSMSASNARFGNTTVITVNGKSLLSSPITVTIEGPCDNLARAGTGSEDTQQFTCSMNGIGSLRAQALQDGGGVLGTLSFDVPTPQVSITTGQGSFVLELDPVAAPITVKNFLAYVNASFYRNVIFHRVIAGLVIQSGAYNAGPTLKPATFPAIKLESANGLKNLRGTITAARGDAADSATAGFWINLADNPQFDRVDDSNPGYAVFGRVISGIDKVDAIGAVPIRPDLLTGLGAVPVTDVIITAISQQR
ncbi:MAG: peptidylprolyl isomerase [Rubrivivax sp.]|nr:peptidylprolyl isomerase [Rubrivivax sp.]